MLQAGTCQHCLFRPALSLYCTKHPGQQQIVPSRNICISYPGQSAVLSQSACQAGRPVSSTLAPFGCSQQTVAGINVALHISEERSKSNGLKDGAPLRAHGERDRLDGTGLHLLFYPRQQVLHRGEVAANGFLQSSSDNAVRR